jgi:glycosyltransferase involved in cell wall biosynthesis
MLAWRPLVDLIRSERIDILHSHKFGSNFWGAVISAAARIPVFVAHEQTWSYEGRPVRRFLDRELIARRADVFIAVSSADRRRIIEVEGVPADKVVIMPNAIPTPRAEGPHDLRGELGVGVEDPIIGAVCVLRRQKALDVLLKAVAILRSRHPRLHTVIVGGGPERASLEQLIDQLGLHGAVSLLGTRVDVAALLPSFDVAVLSSDFEGTPLAMMEYMEAARPIVSTRVGGVPDLISDGVEGLLVEPQDPEALAAAIGALLDDPQRAAKLGEQAQRRRREEFDLAVTARRLERLYLDLLARSSRGR